MPEIWWNILLMHAHLITSMAVYSIIKDRLDISLVIQGMPIENPHYVILDIISETKEMSIGYPHAAIMKFMID